jgi:hypothetical protein
MRQKYSTKQFYIKRIFLIIIISVIGMSIQTVSNKNVPLSIVSAQQDTWSLTLHITESARAGNTVILGGSPNASNDQDDLDLAEPPPPQAPYIRVWFTTPFAVPFNNLLHEYKHVPSERMEWNLSLIWVPEPENESNTTVSISWDPAQAIHSTFNSFQLYDNNTVVANMLTENSYTFPSNGTLHHFQIIGQTISKNNTSENNNLPVVPITLGIIVLVIVAMIALFLYKRKK